MLLVEEVKEYKWNIHGIGGRECNSGITKTIIDHCHKTYKAIIMSWI